LIELLVVITIIGMLAALILPAVNTAREAARRITCVNNQKQLALAVNTSSSAKGEFPGFRQTINSDSVDATKNVYGSWVVVLLPYMEQTQLYERFASAHADVISVPVSVPNSVSIRLQSFICPSGSGDNDPQRLPNYYVANTGNPDYIVGSGFAHENGSGVFVDLVGTNAAGDISKDPRDRASKVTADSFYDGLSNTLLFTESMQASPWAPLNALSGKSGSATSPQNAVWESGVGFCWPLNSQFDRSNCGAEPVVNLIVPFWVNYCKNPDINWDLQANAGNYKYARPNSNHPGLVVIAFADGGASTMSDTVDQYLLKMAMCPNDQKFYEKHGDADLDGIFDRSQL